MLNPKKEKKKKRKNEREKEREESFASDKLLLRDNNQYNKENQHGNS